jgi:hypothetical protein
MDLLTSLLNWIAGRVPEFNSRAVLFALVAGWITGVLWYMVAGRVWSDSLGKGGVGSLTPKAQIFSAIAQVVMTIMLAIVMQRLGEVTTRGGIQTAFTIWIGFVITTMVVNYSNLGARMRLAMIDGVHWLLVLVVMGAIIGALSDVPVRR